MITPTLGHLAALLIAMYFLTKASNFWKPKKVQVLDFTGTKF